MGKNESFYVSRRKEVDLSKNRAPSRSSKRETYCLVSQSSVAIHGSSNKIMTQSTHRKYIRRKHWNTHTHRLTTTRWLQNIWLFAYACFICCINSNQKPDAIWTFPSIIWKFSPHIQMCIFCFNDRCHPLCFSSSQERDNGIFCWRSSLNLIHVLFFMFQCSDLKIFRLWLHFNEYRRKADTMCAKNSSYSMYMQCCIY